LKLGSFTGKQFWKVSKVVMKTCLCADSGKAEAFHPSFLKRSFLSECLAEMISLVKRNEFERVSFSMAWASAMSAMLKFRCFDILSRKLYNGLFFSTPPTMTSRVRRRVESFHSLISGSFHHGSTNKFSSVSLSRPFFSSFLSF